MGTAKILMTAAALALPLTLMGVSAKAEDAKNYSSGEPQSNKSGTGATVKSPMHMTHHKMKHHMMKHHMKKSM
jgi:hypothetical protein